LLGRQFLQRLGYLFLLSGQLLQCLRRLVLPGSDRLQDVLCGLFLIGIELLYRVPQGGKIAHKVAKLLCQHRGSRSGWGSLGLSDRL
jgi:hypothetical protein